MFDFRQEGINSASKLAIAIHTANLDSDDVPILRLTGNIVLRGALPAITRDVSIEGNGFTIDADFASRILSIRSSDVRIGHLVLVNGMERSGGAIFLEGGSLRVSNCTLMNNVSDWGGAIRSEGGRLSIFNATISANEGEAAGAVYCLDSRLDICNCDISANSAEKWSGGAVSVTGGEFHISKSQFSGNVAHIGGGAIDLTDSHASKLSSRISDCIFIKNSASHGGGISSHGKLTVTACSFDGNAADRGGAIFHFGAKLSMQNSTITRNSAREGGGINVAHDSAATLTHVTIARNVAKTGGGTFKLRSGMLNLRNCLLAGNEGGDCVGRISQNVGNLIQEGSTLADINSDPMLGALVEPEDGSPAYHPLLPGSPAIGAGNERYCLPNDQRGTPRPQGEACDIGAIENIYDD